MPEQPSFSSKPLPESLVKPVKPKRATRKKAAPRRKETAAELAEDRKETKISKQLAQIYQDEKGNLPDMRRIKIEKKHGAFKTFVWVLLLGGLLAAAAWAGFFFMPSNKKFSEDKVALRLNGPATSIIGTTTTYKIAYENNQNLLLKNLRLNVQYPDGFVFVSSDISAKNSGHTEWDLGDLRAGQRKEMTITGLTYGTLSQKQSWRAFLTYQPETFGSDFQKNIVLDVTTDKAPFSVTVNGSSKASAGTEAEYTFIVKKETDSAINKLILKPAWPKNFVLASSSPLISKDFTWTIEPNKSPSPSSSAPTSWTFKLVGAFTTSTDTAGEITGALLATANNRSFTLTDTKIAPQVTQNEADLSLAINGSLSNFDIQPGNELNMTLTLKNNSDEDIQNAILKLGLNGPAIKKQTLLDWPHIEDRYDGNIVGSQISDSVRRGEITWDKNKMPALASIKKGQEVTLDIKLPLRDAKTINLADLNSYQITVVGELAFKDSDNKDRKFSSNQIAIIVNSDLTFDARDSVTNQKHAINWVLTNNFHALKNITLSADVYGDVSVELPTPIPAGQAKFDPATKKLTWTIPNMPESVDVLALPINITVNKTNASQQNLISQVQIQADDTVTGEKINLTGEEVKLAQ